MQRIDVLKSGFGIGAASLVSVIPTRASAQQSFNDAFAAGSATNSISTSTPNYAHTLRWAKAPTQDQFKPFGSLTTHAGQLVTNVTHSFKRNKDKSVTHSHSFSNQRAARNGTETTPWLTKPGSFKNSIGQLITVQDQGKGTIQFSSGSTNWLASAEQTAQYSVTAKLENNKGYYWQQVYTADSKNLDTPAILTPDVLYPQNVICCHLEPYGATGVVLGIAGLILGAALAPEIGIALGVIGAGYGIYGEGVASGWW